MSDKPAPDMLAAARLRLQKDRPYLADLLYSLVFIRLDDFPTLGVDRYHRLYYGDQAMTNWGLMGTVAVLYHECNHLMRRHPWRAEDGGYEPGLYNLAGDLEINSKLRQEFKDTAHRLPEGGVFPEQYGLPENLLAEEYYELLPKDTMASHMCGSCAHGGRESHEMSSPTDGEPGIRRAESEIILRRTAESISRNPGSVPNHLRRWAEETLNPRVPWQRLLAGAVRKAIYHAAGCMDYSYSRPSRRQSALPHFIVPSMVKPEVDVVAVVDTSGSMQAKDLGVALTELASLLRQVGCRGVRVLAVDAMVHEAGKCFSKHQVERLMKGGGGTDMSLGITAALKYKPSLIVVITDGWTGWPAQPVKVPVVAVLTRDPSAYYRPPAWIKVIVAKAD